MTRPRSIPTFLALACFVLAGSFLGARPAHAFDFGQISSYDVTIAIRHDGSIQVVERIAYDFGDIAKHGIFRNIPVREIYDDHHWRLFPLHVDSVQGSPGTPDHFKTSRSGSDLVIKIGDPKQTITGLHVYTITYTVKGAMNAFSDHDELYWNAIGAQWDVPINRATVQVQAPGAITQVACFEGPNGSRLDCASARAGGNQATFTQTDIGDQQGLTIVVALPKGAVVQPHPILKERWAIQRAFSVTPRTLGLALGLLALLLAGLGRLLWISGRDRRVRGSPVDIAYAGSASAPPPDGQQPPPDGQQPPLEGEEPVPLFEHSVYPVEYSPPGGIRPGQVGTLVHERADTLDVTATIVDLAVRGYLRIEEIPKKHRFAKPDWRLVMLKGPDDALLPYESMLLNSIFEEGEASALLDALTGADQGEPARSGVAVQTQSVSSVTLSSLKYSFASRLKEVEGSLYDDAMKRGWFSARPDQTRAKWLGRAWLWFLAGVAVMILVAAWTHLGLVAAAIPVAGLVFIRTAHLMPRRTPAGTGMVRRVFGFRTYIETAEKREAQFQERENIFSQYLPFAIVFGCTDKWARAFSHLGDEPSTSYWYVSSHPFTVSEFTSSIEHFSMFTSGTMTSVASSSSSGSSGFGGGGSSGGGGGGGGGGSW